MAERRHLRRLCGHCNEELSYSAFRSHKALYYVESEQRWLSVTEINQDQPDSHLDYDCQTTGNALEHPSTSVMVKNLADSSGNYINGGDEDEMESTNSEINVDSSSDESADELVDPAVVIVEETDEEQPCEKNLENEASIESLVNLILAFMLRFRIVYSIPNRAILVLLKFLKYLLFVIGNSLNVDALKGNIKFPQSMQGCYSHLGLDSNSCTEYVVCPSCELLYNPKTQQLLTGTSLHSQSISCSYIEFPNHPQHRFRQPCNTLLLNRVRCQKKYLFKPRKIYYYYGLKRSLSTLLKCPNFLNLCNEWLDYPSCDLLRDITDGQVWKELISLISPSRRATNTLGLLLNVDWFQPYKDISYSVGVIYGVIINLPRHIRYKDGNVVIIGIIPGPKEPKKNINSYLGPLVSELLQLYSGEWMVTSNGHQFVRCFLMCLSSDIPATRKAAGFLGHMAFRACSRCFKGFPRVQDKTDCSGFQKDSWPPRNNDRHREDAYKTINCKTKADRAEIEKNTGARYSVLLELPYYDAIRFPIIDAMHNLFLGTAKHIMSIWKESNLLSSTDFTTIQKRMELANVPMDIGRIPFKIDSGMSGMTADQWKNWTCVYSTYMLHDLLPKTHLNCWWLFVRACNLVCQPIISNSDIDLIERLLLEFCKVFQRIYGPQSCTINLHLHCHLTECLRDYGPAHATWCFSFERCNGILGKTPNNNRSLQVEKTMINRFVEQMEYSAQVLPQVSELDQFFQNTTSVGTLNETQTSSETFVEHYRSSRGTTLPELKIENSSIASQIGGIMLEHVLQPFEAECLTDMYKYIFPDNFVLNVSPLCNRFGRVKIADKVCSSQMSRSDRSSYICAYWPSDNNLGIDLNSHCRPGRIKYFIKHNLMLQQNGETVRKTFRLAFVDWYQQHPEKNYILSPTTLWSPDFIPISPASFIPVCRIASRCMQLEAQMEFPERPYNNGKTVIITPINSANLKF